MLVRRWIVATLVSSLLATLLVWADECQRPTVNCPPGIKPDTIGRCPNDNEPCVWEAEDTNQEAGFCSASNRNCPNHNPRAGNCTEREIWRTTTRTLRCRRGDGTVCRFIQCVFKVQKVRATGRDCQGHPCAGHPRISNPVGIINTK